MVGFVCNCTEVMEWNHVWTRGSGDDGVVFGARVMVAKWRNTEEEVVGEREGEKGYKDILEYLEVH